MDKPIVEMIGITKRFPGVIANQEVNLNIFAGEIHALLGENGAGKSTLMSVLTGLYQSEEGYINIKGQRVTFQSPKDAIRAGIGMVHQHFKLVEPFTVAENLSMGSQGQGVFLNIKDLEKRLTAFSAEYGLSVDPKAKIWQLSIGEQQRVEIVKLLYRGAEILILDEPTAVLTPQEARDLYGVLQKMAQQGKAIIVITHKLQEVMEHSQRVTVLRGGKAVSTKATSETNEDELAQLMVGFHVDLNLEKAPVKPGKVLLELKGIKALGDKGLLALKDISLAIREGEILGIAGVAGNGQRELAEVITGLRRSTQGTLLVDGIEATNSSPRALIDAGISHIPEDRLGTGLVGSLSAHENAILKNYRKAPILKGGFIQWSQVKEYTQGLISGFQVKIASKQAPMKLLSGGNLQRFLFARELSLNPKVIVAVYPVRGLDIAAIKAVREVLLEERAKGKAILLVSEELEELLALADRIAVLYQGQIMDTIPGDQASYHELGLLMAGKQVKREVESHG